METEGQQKALPEELRSILTQLLEWLLQRLKGTPLWLAPKRQVAHWGTPEGGEGGRFTTIWEPDLVSLYFDARIELSEFPHWRTLETLISTSEPLKRAEASIFLGRGVKGLISPFLSQYFARTRSLDFDYNLFAQVYRDFEEFVLSPYRRLVSFALIKGLLGNFDSLELGAVTIRQLSDAEREDLFSRHLSEYGWVFPRSIEPEELLTPGRLYIAQVEILLPKSEGAIDHSKGDKKIDDVLLVLRLFQSGFIRRQIILHKGKTPWDFPGEGATAPRPPIYGRGGRGEYKLQKDRVTDLVRFWNETSLILEKPPPPLDIAFRRFNEAYERQQAEDQFIDLMVAMEALYFLAGEESGEFQYKLSLRTGMFIEHQQEKPREVIKHMKKMYHLRSQIVHGESTPSDIKDEVTHLEEHARLSLRKMTLALAKGLRQENVLRALEEALLERAPIGLDELARKKD